MKFISVFFFMLASVQMVKKKTSEHAIIEGVADVLKHSPDRKDGGGRKQKGSAGKKEDSELEKKRM